MSDLKIPRDRDDDYSAGSIKARQELIRDRTSSAVEHVGSYSLDPASLPGDDGTGQATQCECLEIMDWYGTGKVRKLAEVIAGTVLAGELSLGSAVVAEE